MNDKPLMIILDASGFAHRAWASASKKFGPIEDSMRMVNWAKHTFNQSLQKISKELETYALEGNDVRLIAALDSGRTWRHDAFPGYKAGRSKPAEYKGLFLRETTLDCLSAAGCELYNSPGFEADDVIASIAVRSAQAGWDVRISTADKDLFQLAKYEGVRISAYNYDTKRYDLLDAAGAEARLGYAPKLAPMYKSIVGDSDGIKGVFGFGPTIGLRLIRDFASLDDLYANLHKLTPGERTKLEAAKSDVYLFERLCTLVECPVVPVELEQIAV